MVYLACALAFVNFDDYNESYYEPLVTPIYGWVALKIDEWQNIELVHSAVDLDGNTIFRSYVPPPPTPEPASGALLLSGCLLLCARRRRRAV